MQFLQGEFVILNLYPVFTVSIPVAFSVNFRMVTFELITGLFDVPALIIAWLFEFGQYPQLQVSGFPHEELTAPVHVFKSQVEVKVVAHIPYPFAMLAYEEAIIWKLSRQDWLQLHFQFQTVLPESNPVQLD